jgi:hypothetical protein
LFGLITRKVVTENHARGRGGCALEFLVHYSYWPPLEILAAPTYMTARCHNPDDHNLTTAVELPFKFSFGSSRFKHETEENLKWRGI